MHISATAMATDSAAIPGGGGGYFRVKRMGMTVGMILENYPKKYQATKFANRKTYNLVKN